MTPIIPTSEDFVRILLLSLPLIVGGILHMVAVKVDILSYLKKPVHHRWFGQNKTWRGLVVMPLATWPGVLLASWWERLAEVSDPLFTDRSSVFLAVVLGLAYCIAEFPNSFMKRRLGIKEGQTSEKGKWFFILVDQSDSVIGCLVAYSFLFQLRPTVILGTLILGTGIHLLFNLLLYSLKLRKNPF